MIPVVLFTYNRLAQTQKVLESLRANKVPLLYIFSDGPRLGDEDKVHEIHNLIDSITWTKTIVMKRHENLGLSDSIKSGLNAVFNKHEVAIVVEDDIQVAPEFYNYMTSALNQYRDVKGITGITGLRYPFKLPLSSEYAHDTFLFPRFSSWGWATWKTVWDDIEWDRNKLISQLKVESSPLEAGGKDLRETFDLYMNGDLTACWDIDIAANMLLKNQVFVWPTWNMVNNLGLLEGTHASGKEPGWKLEHEKRTIKGSYNFYKESFIPIQFNMGLLNFFEKYTTNNIQSKGGHDMNRKNIARKALGIVKRKIIKPKSKVGESQKPDPAEYSTVDNPMDVPVQREAYFIALNKYVNDGDKVLDVGSGLGFGLNYLSIKAKGVVGADIDEKAIEYSKKYIVGKNPKLKELTTFDGYHLPYTDNSFDVVTSIDVLEHVEDYDKYLKELLRVTKKYVMISTPNRRSEYTNPDGTPMNYWHLREWTRPELNSILKKHVEKVDWYHVNGPWEGPHTISKTVKPDTMTLTPVLIKA